MIQSLQKGIEVLMFLEKNTTVTITELAEAFGVNKSTISRIVNTLMEYDLVKRDCITKKYKLGYRILHLGDGIVRGLNVLTLARPHMSLLCNEVRESVHLCAVSNENLYVVDQVKSKKIYNLSASVGMIEPWHCSSVGKCLLAFKGDDFAEKILSTHEMTIYTKNTIIDKGELYKELGKIRERGYAIDNEEIETGVFCIAAPIYNMRGTASYSIGISGPISSINNSNVHKYAAHLLKCCKIVSELLGAPMHRINK